MSWKVFYSAKAKQDLQNIYEYIAFELLVPKTAAGQIHRLIAMIRSLNQMPLRHPVYDEEPWKSKNIRTVAVDHYLVFYLPQEKDKTVTVVRIIYGGRDLTKQKKDSDDHLPVTTE
jgi:toxin ParE1/3/4